MKLYLSIEDNNLYFCRVPRKMKRAMWFYWDEADAVSSGSHFSFLFLFLARAEREP